eukprot:scaffold279216_cov25-Prasinocladus_malaysianus.AAC.1
MLLYYVVGVQQAVVAALVFGSCTTSSPSFSDDEDLIRGAEIIWLLRRDEITISCIQAITSPACVVCYWHAQASGKIHGYAIIACKSQRHCHMW